MLYISSRCKTDSFTAHRTLCSDYAPDGGMFIPYQIPQYSVEDLQQLKHTSFCNIVAKVLNLFFSCRLTAWEVEVCIGRMPIRIKEMSHRLLTAESFHNPAGDYSYAEEHLYQKLAGTDAASKPTVWARIAIRIALLFGIYGSIPESVCQSFDICVNADDFTVPMSAWYARKMGLPICTIICSCKENGDLWDLIQKGECSTATLGTTGTANQIEGLLYHIFGRSEATAFSAVCARKGTYRLEKDALPLFSDGLAAAVVGPNRTESLIRSVYRTNSYFITDAAAVSYGGLQDYRANTGESRHTLILMDSSPARQVAAIAAATGMTESEIVKTF